MNLDPNEPFPSQVVKAFTVITITPDPMVSAAHNRMPVILGSEHTPWWSESKFEPHFIKTLLRPNVTEDMDCHRVSSQVNRAKKDSPECIQFE